MAGDHVVWWASLYALIVSLALQVGVNYANDYSDGVRGTDQERVGPVRLVASGRAEPRSVKEAAFLCFGVAAVAGLVLALATTLWLVVVGAFAVLAAWFYTGGRRPYGYAGLGELFVLVFFGFVAVAGTAYVSLHRVSALALVTSVPIGLMAVAMLVANNLRDIPGDSAAGKRTLAVRLGDRRTRFLYAGCLAVAFVMVPVIAVFRPPALLALIAVVVAVGPLRAVLRGATGRQLVPVLGMTGRLQVVFGALLAIGLVL